MSSVTGVRTIPGSRFNAGVVHAGDVAEQPAEKLQLPGGSRVGLLAELPVAKDPAARAHLKDLMGRAFALEKEILEFAQARFIERRADLEGEHELAKAAVREQKDVLDKLTAKLDVDRQDVIRAQNALTIAQGEAADASRSLQSLSPFSARETIEAATKRVRESNKKVAMAERKAGELQQYWNYATNVTREAEQKKLAALIETVAGLSASLAGRDPIQAVLGIQQC